MVVTVVSRPEGYWVFTMVVLQVNVCVLIECLVAFLVCTMKLVEVTVFFIGISSVQYTPRRCENRRASLPIFEVFAFPSGGSISFESPIAVKPGFLEIVTSKRLVVVMVFLFVFVFVVVSVWLTKVGTLIHSQQE